MTANATAISAKAHARKEPVVLYGDPTSSLPVGGTIFVIWRFQSTMTARPARSATLPPSDWSHRWRRRSGQWLWSAQARTITRAGGARAWKRRGGAAGMAASPAGLGRGRGPPESAMMARQRPGRYQPRRKWRRNRMPASDAFSAPGNHREAQAPDLIRRSTPQPQRTRRRCRRTGAPTTAQIGSRARKARPTLRISPSLEPRACPRQLGCRINQI
jgi:hypothetical protein